MQQNAGVELADQASLADGASERIVVVAPTGDDAALVVEILQERGFDVIAVENLGSLTREIERGAGVALIASEALDDSAECGDLRKLLERQEAWSEIPLLILGGRADEAEAARATELLGAGAHIVLLERPLGIATFVTATDAALRSRRRQYEVKRLLTEVAESAAAVARAHEDADRAKDDFLASLAHELRSPMTAIRGWIQMLKTGTLDSSETADALSMIESSTKVQSHIIEDLMDVSRIMTGKVMIDPAWVELTPVIVSVVETFRPAATQQNIDLSVDLPTKPVIVWADDVRLQQIGWNLISNAIKFTPSGGAVRISLGVESASAVIRVGDTGQGISPELLPHVFERYRQEDRVVSKQQRGLGLGLSIVRHLVESHDGTIEAFSEGLGKGSEFVVRLPLRPPGSEAS